MPCKGLIKVRFTWGCLARATRWLWLCHSWLWLQLCTHTHPHTLEHTLAHTHTQCETYCSFWLHTPQVMCQCRNYAYAMLHWQLPHAHRHRQTHAVPIRCVPHTAYTYHRHAQAHCVYVHLICLSTLSASDATACGICQLIFCCTLLEIHTLCMPLLLHPSRKHGPLFITLLLLQSSTSLSSAIRSVFCACLHLSRA